MNLVVTAGELLLPVYESFCILKTLTFCDCETWEKCKFFEKWQNSNLSL